MSLHCRSALPVGISRAVVSGLTIGAVGGIALAAGLAASGALLVAVPFLAALGAAFRLALAALSGEWRAAHPSPLRHRVWRIENLATAVIVAATVSVLLPAAEQAREAARATKCRNNLFQHSGCHRDFIVLNASLDFDHVWSCWCCSQLNLAPAVLITRANGECSPLQLADGVPSSVALQLGCQKLAGARRMSPFVRSPTQHVRRE